MNLLNFLVESWYLVLVAIVSGGLLLWPMIKGGAYGGKINVKASSDVVIKGSKVGVN